MRTVQAHSAQLEAVGREILLIVRGDPQGDLRRRLLAGCARCYVLATDRPTAARQTLYSLTEPPPELYRDQWRWPYNERVPDDRFIVDLGRKAVLARIAQGDLGIEERLGVWNGSFWHGLKISGAIRRGPGTEWRIWERSHGELVADLSEMPLMHKLEPRTAKHGQRRLRRCYAVFLPQADPLDRSVLAGLFAGAVIRADGGESWMELPDNQGVRDILGEWGLPFIPVERPKGMMLLRISPLCGALVAHLMPRYSAGRMLAIRKAGGCPYLSVVLWEMAMGRKNMRYMPFYNALPFGCSKAAFFRRGWHRRDLLKAGWLELGIRITPMFRELMVDWFDRWHSERMNRSHDPSTCPVPPSCIPAQQLPAEVH